MPVDIIFYLFKNHLFKQRTFSAIHIYEPFEGGKEGKKLAQVLNLTKAFP